MFNRATTIGRAIESALAQTDGDFELLVVDDCSTDESVWVVKSYDDSRIRLLRARPQSGPCPARNTAIAAARGQWCVMLDSDFAFLPGALAALRARAADGAGADVGNLASSCLWDDGARLPSPPRPTVDPGFSRVSGVARYGPAVSEKLECIRRSVFQTSVMPTVAPGSSSFTSTWHPVADRDRRRGAGDRVLGRPEPSYHGAGPRRFVACSMMRRTSWRASRASSRGTATLSSLGAGAAFLSAGAGWRPIRVDGRSPRRGAACGGGAAYPALGAGGVVGDRALSAGS